MAFSPPSSSCRFSPPVVTEPVTAAADVGNSAELLHTLKRAKVEGHTAITPELPGHAEHVHTSTLDRDAVQVQFTQADRDSLTELKEYLDKTNYYLHKTNAKVDNMPRRLANSRACAPPHALVCLGVEEPSSQQPLGTMPHFKQQAGGDNPPPGDDDPLSIFPATRGDLADLEMSDFDNLEAFYGVRFAGACKVARMCSFMSYIGT